MKNCEMVVKQVPDKNPTFRFIRNRTVTGKAITHISLNVIYKYTNAIKIVHFSLLSRFESITKIQYFKTIGFFSKTNDFLI